MRNTFFIMIILAMTGVFFLSLDTEPEGIQIFDRKRSDVQSRDIALVDPEDAPTEIREEVMKGYRLVIDTQTHAKEYAGDRLNCRNCHFEGGNTLGGVNGSISLVGVAYSYPKFSERSGKMQTLAERINNCFERSLNGRPLPVDGPEMKALLTYFAWISEPVKNHKEFPWQGLPKIVGKYTPSAEKGKEVYSRCCAVCHGNSGEGTRQQKEEKMLDIPPVYGEESFNDGAGMSTIAKIAPFVYLNMPYQQPSLTQEEAMDVAEYVIKQKRPRFNAAVQ